MIYTVRVYQREITENGADIWSTSFHVSAPFYHYSPSAKSFCDKVSEWFQQVTFPTVTVMLTVLTPVEIGADAPNEIEGTAYHNPWTNYSALPRVPLVQPEEREVGLLLKKSVEFGESGSMVIFRCLNKDDVFNTNREQMTVKNVPFWQGAVDVFNENVINLHGVDLLPTSEGVPTDLGLFTQGAVLNVNYPVQWKRRKQFRRDISEKRKELLEYSLQQAFKISEFYYGFKIAREIASPYISFTLVEEVKKAMGVFDELASRYAEVLEDPELKEQYGPYKPFSRWGRDWDTQFNFVKSLKMVKEGDANTLSSIEPYIFYGGVPYIKPEDEQVLQDLMEKYHTNIGRHLEFDFLSPFTTPVDEAPQ
jgi:hypothetical protein